MSRRKWLAALLGILLALAGCSDSTDDAESSSSSSAAGAEPVTGPISVFAAASLKEAFDAIQVEFVKTNPDAEVTFEYGASGQLATQIQQGAPADLFASADTASMTTLTDASLVDEPQDFAKNQIEIVVPADNPGNVESIDDLQNADLTIVTCVETAACGKITVKLEELLGYQIATDSQEPDVKSVLQKVSLGEADAGLVYVTDVQAAGDAVKGIPIEEADSLANTYPIAVNKAAANSEGAQAFMDFVLSDAGQKILADKGFATP